MNGVRLTVGIPTFNRADDLRLALDSVLVQASDLTLGQLEVLVSDNASTDQTASVVREYEARYPGVVVGRRNPVNLGFSRNVDSVVRHARGEFVLLLGDDDGLEGNALETVWRILDRHGDLGVIFLSETAYDCDLRAPLPFAGEKNGFPEDELYRPGVDYVLRNKVFPPFLVSGYVVRRDAWISSRAEEFCDTICVHALVALRIFLDYAAYRSFTPVVRYRVENKGGNRWQDELYPFSFHLNLLVGCRAVRPNYPPRLHRYLHRQAMRSVTYHLLDLKVAGGPLNAALLRKRLDELSDREDPLFWFNRLLLIAPSWSLKIPFRVLMRLRQGRN